MSNSYEKYDKYTMESGCPAWTYEEAEVTVPVVFYAGADVGKVEMKCMGEPCVKCNADPHGKPGALSRFTISQRLRVEIPVVFSAEADIGEACVKYERCGKKHGDHDCEADDDSDCQDTEDDSYDCLGKKKRQIR